MSVIISALADFAWLFYIAIGLAMLYFLFALLSGLRNMQRSAFSMERGRARGEINSSLLRLLLCGLAAITLYGAMSQVERGPGIIERLSNPASPTATAGFVVQYFGTPTAQSNANTASAPITAVRPLTVPGAAPVAPLSPAAAATVAAGGLPPNNCGSNTVRIEALAAPAKQLTITGTAFIEAGGQWRLELLLPGGSSTLLQRGDVSALGPNVVRGLSLQSLANGTYGVRLSTLRADGTIGGICQRSVGIGI